LKQTKTNKNSVIFTLGKYNVGGVKIKTIIIIIIIIINKLTDLTFILLVFTSYFYAPIILIRHTL